MRRLARVWCLALCACTGGTEPVIARPRVTRVVVVPSSVNANTGERLQLRATVEGDSGLNQAVQWTAQSSLSGSVSADGILSTCYPTGVFTVTARSVADPTRSVEVPVSVSMILLGWGGISALVRPGGAFPSTDPRDRIPADSVTGVGEFVVSLTPNPAIACRVMESYQLELEGATQSYPLPLRTFEKPVQPAYAERRTFDSRTVQNGAYIVRVNLKIADVPGVKAVGQYRITIRNP
jgi:hypothetical protein